MTKLLDDLYVYKRCTVIEIKKIKEWHKCSKMKRALDTEVIFGLPKSSINTAPAVKPEYDEVIFGLSPSLMGQRTSAIPALVVPNHSAAATVSVPNTDVISSAPAGHVVAKRGRRKKPKLDPDSPQHEAPKIAPVVHHSSVAPCSVNAIPTLHTCVTEKSALWLPENGSSPPEAILRHSVKARAPDPQLLEQKVEETVPSPNDLKDHLFTSFLAGLGYRQPLSTGPASFPNFIKAIIGEPFFNSIVVDEKLCRVMKPSKFNIPETKPTVSYNLFCATYSRDCQFLYEAGEYVIPSAGPHKPAKTVMLRKCANDTNCVGVSGLIPSEGLHEDDGGPFRGRVLMAYGDPSVDIENDHYAKTENNCCLLCLRSGVLALSCIAATQDFDLLYGRKTPMVEFYNSSDYNPAAMQHRTTKLGLVEPVVACPLTLYCWKRDRDGRYYVDQSLIAFNGDTRRMYNELLSEQPTTSGSAEPKK